MAHLKITTPEGHGDAVGVAGSTARCWLNGVEISQYVFGIRVDVPVDGPVKATIELYVGTLELGLNANMLFTVPELQSIAVGGEQAHVVRD
jgi:glycyl-tRNA synthetase alpha subunit